MAVVDQIEAISGASLICVGVLLLGMEHKVRFFVPRFLCSILCTKLVTLCYICATSGGIIFQSDPSGRVYDGMAQQPCFRCRVLLLPAGARESMAEASGADAAKPGNIEGPL